MPLGNLPPSTRALLEVFQQLPGIQAFTLVGGTALALRHGHRISEDLDFAFLGGARLPRMIITELGAELGRRGFPVALIPHPADEDDFADAGLDLLDYQQDYFANVGPHKVKLTYFRPHDFPAATRQERERLQFVEIGTDREIFAMKALVLAEKLRARDVFDIWWLMDNCGLTLADFVSAYESVGQRANVETAFRRVFAGRFAPNDLAYQAADGSAPDPHAVCQLLAGKIETWMRESAKSALAAAPKNVP